jgi:hypothetical protein
MSYLNALASAGLTVGLRFFPANTARRAPVSEAAPVADRPVSSGEAGPVETVRAASKPLSPEERAAGWAEARAQLAAEGILGRLGLASPEAAGLAAAEMEAEEAEKEVAWVQSAVAGTEKETAVAQPAEVETEEEAAGSQSAEDEKDSGPTEGAVKELTPEEEAQVRKLAQRDREVRAHEQAHVAASGGLAGSPSYEYQTGPDGRRYAVGGEVSIRRGGATDTDQALREAEAVKRGATAPAKPSSQDMAVAARADADIQRLRAKKAQERREGKEDRDEGPAASPANFASDSAGLKDASRTPEKKLGAGETLSEPTGLKDASMVPEKTPANGVGFGVQAAWAYAAVKLGFQNSIRPLLAQI